MIKVGILGATGYVGAELTRLLSQHSEVEIMFLDSRSYASMAYSKVYSNFKDIVEDQCTSINLEEDLENIDLLFCALPHGLSQKAVKKIVEKKKKVVDLSADFRIKSVATYEKWYGVEHEAVKELEKAVYGLSEIYSHEIAKADLVSNPGCYPTSILLPLYPLLKEKIISTDAIIIDAKSGVSGAGRTPGDGNLFAQCNENLKAYGIGTHRHTPEIEQELSIAAGEEVTVQFTPHLIPMTRGILSTIYAPNKKTVSQQEVKEIYKTYYQHQPFIRLLEDNEYPQTKAVYASNYCDIGLKVDPRTNNIIIVSVIDNLVKGAAGQAVQNMNLMFGLPQEKGLQQPPIWP
ncbi:N-acetyl-gamma-glutamyl-phosphate reductase ArgC [Clostridium aceticum]|uniref:N-acetyl-gamma-glutamyl-phosphate reductase n=1 Tax=Clostridium aceticum TaxID=84022 RepID=A0A0D8IET3_9CLOT|nr:N-acetyl-gamma-glutamyl-phosphate reductase [Clostridium aceticum]AKL94170.1 N-acetyl-gamma-glutamyl-phosphate reductase ArgC [Clostridium aceticum]KJF28487.1 N-acetyl-gamma-glutamyl-phosphate reductase [Clostridium aceticum]